MFDDSWENVVDKCWGPFCTRTKKKRTYLLRAQLIKTRIITVSMEKIVSRVLWEKSPGSVPDVGHVKKDTANVMKQSLVAIIVFRLTVCVKGTKESSYLI